MPSSACARRRAGFDQLLAGCDVGSLLAAADDDDDSQPSTRATSPPRAGRTDSGVSSKGRGIEKTSSAPRREGPLKAKKDHRPHMSKSSAAPCASSFTQRSGCTVAPARKPTSTAASDKRSSALKGALEAWAADLSAMDDLCGALSGAGVQK